VIDSCPALGAGASIRRHAALTSLSLQRGEEARSVNRTFLLTLTHLTKRERQSAATMNEARRCWRAASGNSARMIGMSRAKTGAQDAANSNAFRLPVFAFAGEHPIRAQEVARSITVRPIDLP